MRLRRSSKRKSNRLPDYNYSSAGYYFVTVCTGGQIQHLGAVENGIMVLSDAERIVQERWLGIPDHYGNVKLDEFVIMPNHIHGIIMIEEYSSTLRDANVRTEHCSVPTTKNSKAMTGLTRRYGLLSKVVKSFKNAVTRDVRAHLSTVGFEWHRSFYDHVIRNENSLNEIRKYISQNPAKWSIDEYNTSGIGAAK